MKQESHSDSLECYIIFFLPPNDQESMRMYVAYICLSDDVALPSFRSMMHFHYAIRAFRRVALYK